MSFKAPESLAEQIAHHLGERIITGQMQSNERIQELKVAGELEVSRGSVREALLILEGRHLIEILPRRGAIVTELNKNRVETLYETYVTLLVMLVTKVTEKWQQGDLEPLVEHYQKMKNHTANFTQHQDAESSKQIIAAGFELMRLAYPIANNQYLEDILEDLQPAVHRCYFLALNLDPEELDRNMAFFGQLLEAVLKRDVVQAQAAIKGYTDHLLMIMFRALEAK